MLTRSHAAAALSFVAALAACHRTQTRIVTTEERVDPGAFSAAPRTREDSLRQASMRRADSAAALVDTIVVMSPTTIRLRAGDSLPFYNVMRLEARGRGGDVVRGFT